MPQKLNSSHSLKIGRRTANSTITASDASRKYTMAGEKNSRQRMSLCLRHSQTHAAAAAPNQTLPAGTSICTLPSVLYQTIVPHKTNNGVRPAARRIFVLRNRHSAVSAAKVTIISTKAIKRRVLL